MVTGDLHALDPDPLARAFGGKKHEIAWADGFVMFCTISQKRALFHRLVLRARALNDPWYTPGF
jgi:hypothetical protein